MSLARRLGGCLLVASLLALAGCEAVTFETIPDGKVNQAQKDAAKKFALDTLGAWASDTYPPVTVPADPKFKASQDDPSKQRAADKALEGQFGEMRSLRFHEAVGSDPPQFVVYRFKAAFSRWKEPLEVRVVYDTEGKLGGFWVKPWKDVMQ